MSVVSHPMIDVFQSKSEAIASYLSKIEADLDLPLYTSVDIRDANFKSAVVDTNLFPAGFNNLCYEDPAVASLMKTAILSRLPHCQHILLISEEHTRNTWYLENIRVLKNITEAAGFKVTVATFLDDQPSFCQDQGFVDLETATGKEVRFHCLAGILKQFESNEYPFDFVMLNNDLSTGIPSLLRDIKLPIYPSFYAGWSNRSKTQHFDFAHQVIDEFADAFELDAWLFKAYHRSSPAVDIQEPEDRQLLADLASDLLRSVKEKYNEYGIDQSPFLFIKANAGTYGMGVMPIEDPSQLLELNRKARNKLSKGKSSRAIDSFILQEGVPSVSQVANETAEACVYSLDNQFLGGFYRVNAGKSDRANLNSKGMTFQKMCTPNDTQCLTTDSAVKTEIISNQQLAVYQTLARLAGIAAAKEVAELEKAAS